jgi:hypothetical protein
MSRQAVSTVARIARVLSTQTRSRAAVVLFLGLAGIAAAAVAPSPYLVVRVEDAETRRPLPNAQVFDRDGNVQPFTNVAGEAVVRRESRPLRLRVRQLGYAIVDTVLPALPPDRENRDTVVIALRRIAYRLGGVSVQSKRGCDSVAAPLFTAEALAQLQQGAERYVAFRETWPFRVRLGRRTLLLNSNSTPLRATDDREVTSSEDWGVPYRPGTVISRSGAGFSVPLLFVTALADTTFLNRHCFAAQQVTEWRGHRVVRLTFWPDSTVDSPDWEGVALIDSATSILRKLDFQVTGLAQGDRPRRLEGYTIFSEPASLVALPESTSAVWWRSEPDSTGAWGGPNVAQLLRVYSLEWRKGRPPSPEQR